MPIDSQTHWREGRRKSRNPGHRTGGGSRTEWWQIGGGRRGSFWNLSGVAAELKKEKVCWDLDQSQSDSACGTFFPFLSIVRLISTQFRVVEAARLQNAQGLAALLDLSAVWTGAEASTLMDLGIVDMFFSHLSSDKAPQLTNIPRGWRQDAGFAYLSIMSLGRMELLSADLPASVQVLVLRAWPAIFKSDRDFPNIPRSDLLLVYTKMPEDYNIKIIKPGFFNHPGVNFSAEDAALGEAHFLAFTNQTRADLDATLARSLIPRGPTVETRITLCRDHTSWKPRIRTTVVISDTKIAELSAKARLLE
ncbi:hypothetical protein C8J57DRAFT_1587929 [Mycena rebaudengoi]|nr:hypothetical protein C8J57DRAFT_1587929 [Mycena rebaudengoi]